MTLGVRALVANANGEILLVRHSYVSGWHLPGGGVERGETLRHTLVRELKEEAGVTLEGEASLFAVYYNSKGSPRDHVALFVVRAFRQDAEFRPSAEILGRKFFPPVALPADATAATRQRIAEVLEGVAINEYW
jgi:ADP-ribose pyrophosphatase YjhB (NUDIX family)